MSDVPRGRERRVNDRRSPRRAPTAEESWFGAFGSAEDTQISPEEGAATKVPKDPAPTSSSTLDSRLFSRQAERIVSAGQTAFDRIYRTFIGARAALGVAEIFKRDF